MSDASFSDDERKALAPFFTNVDRPVFALVNLPETVKGALFARYSRSPKSLRRLFLDEFYDKTAGMSGTASSGVGAERADRLYERVFNDYGDDSVAQLGGAHIAVEHASNILTKVLERGRLMAYLEQSTRYIPYTDREGGAWRYLVPAELDGHPLRAKYTGALDAAFETYAKWIDPMRAWFEHRHPKQPGDSDAVHRAAIRAKALDTLRGLLPAATRSNVRDLWHGAGLRGAAASYARASAAGSANDRRCDARRAARGDAGVSRSRRPAGARWKMERVFRGHAAPHGRRLGAPRGAGAGRGRCRRRGDAHGVRSRRRGEDRGRRALRVDGLARSRMSRAGALVVHQ